MFLLFFKLLFIYLFIYLFILVFWAPPWHMELPRLQVLLELQILTYTTATAKQYQSVPCYLQYSSWQSQIINPLREARDWTQNLMVASQIIFFRFFIALSFKLLLFFETTYIAIYPLQSKCLAWTVCCLSQSWH